MELGAWGAGKIKKILNFIDWFNIRKIEINERFQI
jgi:hypothetical protein